MNHPQQPHKAGVFAPLVVPTFRNIWLASLISNTGALIQGVGSAWVMAEISTPSMVAMVQTATFLPMALLAIPAGAIADMYDRRKSQIAALSIALGGALILTLLSLAGLITPWSLLGMCFFIGCGMALYGPAWQSSPGEQVPPNLLPQAVALNGISYNVARSFGPALGGAIVATAGATAAFAANFLCYFPVLLALLAWRRTPLPTRLPPERLGRAMMSGMRYIVHMQPVRTAIVRSVVTGILGAALLSMMPLIARDMLGGSARVFGVMLGFFGFGAVAAIFILQPIRRFGNERVVSGCSLVLAACVACLAISHNLAATSIVLLIAGGAWMIQVTTVNIAVQLFVPRWVTGRAVAALNATVAGGIAGGAAIWGIVAQQHGTQTALLTAATILLISPLMGLVLPIADRENAARSLDEPLADPEVNLGITGRSGPIIIELAYRVPSEQAREFYDLMRQIQRIRARNGAYDWSLSRNINDPERWVERYRTPTWHDYLRQRSRCTAEEMIIQQRSRDFLADGAHVEVERWLERPFGSVRWRAESPDQGG
ncbi:Predicted arabinose efflux permease, MFS family [Sphingobium faniae]|nr:Predicted arabinose efflux permease, MFS family [Sphingobium faniae]